MILRGKEHANICPAVFQFDMETGLTVVARSQFCDKIFSLTLEQAFATFELLDGDEEESFLWVDNGGHVAMEVVQ